MNVYIGSNSRLPSGYQEVEYIESSGAQVIKTGVYMNTTGYRANLEYQNTSTSPNDQAVFGFYMESEVYAYRTGYNSNNDFTLSKGSTSLDKQTATGGSTTRANSSYQFYIFAKQRYANGNYDSNAYCKLYSCQIYNSINELIRDFVPCYRKSDSVIGLYDIVNDTFYTNQGSGSFTKGADVYMSELQNAYIGEYKGWKPGANTIAYYPLKSDFNDAKTSGTKYNLTNSGATLSELGGVTCANFNGSNSKATGAFYSYGTGDLTASVRGYPLSNNQGVWWCIGLTTLVMNSKNGVVEGTSAPTPTNTWTNIVFTITGGKLKIYSNGTLYLDTNFSNNVTGDLMLGIDGSYRFWFYGGVSELIFENRAWTQQEISDYYNQTKSNYGL